MVEREPQVQGAFADGGVQRQLVLAENIDLATPQGYSVCWDNVQLEAHRKHSVIIMI